jgi:hypothetical protein
MTMENELRQLIDAGNRAMVSLGVRLRTFEQNGHIVAQAYLPTQPRPMVISARVALPSDVVGGKLGKKIKAKVKTVATKVAKSKVLRGVAKVAMGLAASALPGGAAIAAGASAIGIAKKLRAAAKNGTPKQKLAAKVIAKAATKNIQRARGNAAPVPPGYPQASAAAVPDSRLPGGSGYADTPDEDFEQAMDFDSDAPTGDVEMESDEEIGPDESADDSSADYSEAAE